ncbi:unnamed protein product [Rotaria sordida]|uniref:Uncharacterized protein n=1 Tax=Rotaria sordida TaxID=392033 RepID=A0A813SSH0_9BILA|nr:unnamed protein product [Rotaria sordida]CAF0846235.1 unnamed protein product [Rotaria sordida]
MESSTANPAASNLATLLLVKRKLAKENADKIGEGQVSPILPAITGAHSNEKLPYRPNMSVINSTSTTATTTPTNMKESPKPSGRKNKQLEVELLDKKIEEINRKQEVITNETLVTWKGFDSLNYRFTAEPEIQKSSPIPPISTKQRTPTPSSKIQPSRVKTPEKLIIETQKQESPVNQQPIETYSSATSKQSTPQRINSSVKDRASSTLPSKMEEPQKERIDKQSTPQRVNSPVKDRPSSTLPSKMEEPQKERIDKQSSPSPRYSEVHSASSLDKFEPLPLPISNNRTFKLFPDIKHNETKRTRNAHKSIQRSMDRYRFHVW